jgi:hypothetical protein
MTDSRFWSDFGKSGAVLSSQLLQLPLDEISVAFGKVHKADNSRLFDQARLEVLMLSRWKAEDDAI